MAIKLVNSLNFSADSLYVNPKIENFCGYEQPLKNALTSGNGFLGIGGSTAKFYGIFDGNCCTISNLYMNSSQNSSSGIGLFASNYGTINNIALKNLNIIVEFNGEDGTCFVGGLAGTNNGMISGVCTSGKIDTLYTGTRNKSIRCGGVIGQISYGTVQNCYNTVNIKTEGNVATNIGGIVGGLAYEALLSNSYNIGIVTQINNKAVNAGSIVGSNSQTTSTISNCYYLENTYSVGIGKRVGTADIEENIVKTSNYMKSSDFLNLLGNAFKIEKNKNNGYPILNWQ